MIASFINSLGPATLVVTQTLIHSLWQGGLIALLLTAALWMLRNSDARLRYFLSCLAMASVVAWCVVTGFYFGFQAQLISGPSLTEAVAVAPATDAAIGVSGPAASITADESVSWGIGQFQRWLVPVWMLGVILLSLRHVFGWKRVRRMVTGGTEGIPLIWKQRFANLCGELKISRPVQLVSSARAKVPCVVGWLKPVVLVPVTMFNGLETSDIELIIVHELAHIRRHDILVNIIQTVAETLLFFNPAIWWISRQIRIEREHCCDDVVVACRKDRLGYARALANLEEMRTVGTGFAMAADGTPLLKRVSRIVGVPAHNSRPASLGVAGVLLMAVFLGVGLGAFGGPTAAEAAAETLFEASERFDPQKGDISGKWEIETDGRRAQVSIRFRPWRGRTGFSVRTKDLLPTIDETTTYFKMSRDAGTFYFEGEFERDDGELWGSGDCFFRADPAYVDQMDGLGFDIDDDEDVLTLAVHDVTLEFAKGLAELGYDNLSFERLIEAHIHNVTPEYVRELNDLGYSNLRMSKLVEMQIHDVEPEYVRELADLGYSNIKPSRLVEMQIHDVEPEMIKELNDNGYRDLSISRLVEMQIHNVDPEYIREFAELGYKDIDPSRLVEMRIHNVTPSYVEKLIELGYDDIRPSRLVEMQIHNVTPRYIADLQELGYEDVSPSRLIEMKIHNVSPSFIRKLQERGYDDLSPSELIEYKIHGRW